MHLIYTLLFFLHSPALYFFPLSPDLGILGIFDFFFVFPFIQFGYNRNGHLEIENWHYGAIGKRLESKNSFHCKRVWCWFFLDMSSGFLSIFIFSCHSSRSSND